MEAGRITDQEREGGDRYDLCGCYDVHLAMAQAHAMTLGLGALGGEGSKVLCHFVGGEGQLWIGAPGFLDHARPYLAFPDQPIKGMARYLELFTYLLGAHKLLLAHRYNYSISYTVLHLIRNYVTML